MKKQLCRKSGRLKIILLVDFLIGIGMEKKVWGNSGLPIRFLKSATSLMKMKKRKIRSRNPS